MLFSPFEFNFALGEGDQNIARVKRQSEILRAHFYTFYTVAGIKTYHNAENIITSI